MVNVQKILNTSLILFPAKMFILSAGSHKILVKIENREDPDQTACSEAVHCLSRPLVVGN